MDTCWFNMVDDDAAAAVAFEVSSALLKHLHNMLATCSASHHWEIQMGMWTWTKPTFHKRLLPTRVAFGQWKVWATARIISHHRRQQQGLPWFPFPLVRPAPQRRRDAGEDPVIRVNRLGGLPRSDDARTVGLPEAVLPEEALRRPTPTRTPRTARRRYRTSRPARSARPRTARTARRGAAA